MKQISELKKKKSMNHEETLAHLENLIKELKESDNLFAEAIDTWDREHEKGFKEKFEKEVNANKRNHR